MVAHTTLLEIVSDYDHEILQNADNPLAPRGRDAQQVMCHGSNVENIYAIMYKSSRSLLLMFTSYIVNYTLKR